MHDLSIPTAHELGEGLLWHPTEQRLYWIDVYAGDVYRQSTAATGYEKILGLAMPIGAIGFREQGGLVLATQKGFALSDASFQNIDFIHDPEATRTHSRFNDGAVDARGRFWAGTMQDGGVSNQDAAVYRCDPDGSVQVMDRDYKLVNGMDWSPDGRTMYITDSLKYTIWQYDFDVEAGTISNKRPFITTEAGEPDGLTVDTEGYVWSARWGGGRVFRYAPDGQLERTIDLPTPHITNCAFGGSDLSTLYISSAKIALDEAGRKQYPQAGNIFISQSTFKGRAPHFFKG